MHSRTQLGLVISTVWIAAWTGYAFHTQHVPNPRSLTPNEWGDFMAGVFGSLAFLWLVLGYYQQGEELKQNTEALKNQAEEIKNSNEALRLQVAEMQKATEHAAAQAQSISANEMHARRDVFFRHAEILISDMRYLAADMLMNSCGLGQKSRDLAGVGLSLVVFDDLFRALFPECVIENVSRMYLNNRWPGNAERYLSGYNNLINAAGECDPSGETSKWLESAPYGVLAKRLREVVHDLPTQVINVQGVHPGGDLKQTMRYFLQNRKSGSP